jgi:hypothetical protein
MAEITIAALIVTANCLNKAPEMPDKADRNENRQQHQCDRNDRCGDLLHRLLGGIRNWKLWLLLHHTFDIFDNNNRVIDDDANRKHQCKK